MHFGAPESDSSALYISEKSKVFHATSISQALNLGLHFREVVLSLPHGRLYVSLNRKTSQIQELSCLSDQPHMCSDPLDGQWLC